MKTTYWTETFQYNTDLRERPALVKNISIEMRKRNLTEILELGCGRGRNSVWLSRENLSVTSLDCQFEYILALKKYAVLNNITMNIVQADAVELPFKEDSFGVVLSSAVLAFIKEYARPLVIEEVKRVLKPKGLFVIVEISQKDPSYGKGHLLEKDTYAYEGETLHFFSPQEMRSLLSSMQVAVLNESRVIDTSHGPLHIHGNITAVAINDSH
ncbi:MAG: class I SAM-dependent methyltransferase [Candidatus Methanofastidiosia archaeon]